MFYTCHHELTPLEIILHLDYMKGTEDVSFDSTPCIADTERDP